MPKSEDDFNREALTAELERASFRNPHDGSDLTIEQQVLRLVDALFAIPCKESEIDSAPRIRARWFEARTGKGREDIETWSPEQLDLLSGALLMINEIVLTTVVAVASITENRR